MNYNMYNPAQIYNCNNYSSGAVLNTKLPINPLESTNLIYNGMNYNMYNPAQIQNCNSSSSGAVPKTPLPITPLPTGGGAKSAQKPVDYLDEAYNEKILSFIDLIDNLRRFGIQQDVSLPNVVVVGDQNSGKSSIIEAISGIQLPRGKGIVTRCPLELQLKWVPQDTPWVARLSYKTEQDLRDIEIDDPSRVEDHIIEAQNAMCGEHNGVSRDLITLRVESPDYSVPYLTLISLPRITRTGLQGQLYNIIRDHISKENTVIMCVVPANVDAAENVSIKLAKRFDPKGKRVFGVITKPDTTDDAKKDAVLGLLNNENISLELGYHMVKCRSQKDLDERVTLEQSVDNEKIFFETDNHYSKAKKSQLGTASLASNITLILFKVIQDTLPALKDKINESLERAQKELCSLPPEIPETAEGKLVFLIEVISEMNNEIKSSLTKGKSTIIRDNHFYTWQKFFTGLKMRMDEIKKKAVQSTLSEESLKQEMGKERGNEIISFINFELYESLITEHVARYKPEAEILLEQMVDNTNKMIEEIINHYFQHLPAIESKMKEILLEELKEANKKTEARIDVIFEEEKMVFTQDSQIEIDIERIRNEETKAVTKIANPSKEKTKYNEESLKENSKRLFIMIDGYLKIVQTRLADLIPMSIHQGLHAELSRNLCKKLFELSMHPGICEKMTENKYEEKHQKLCDKIKRLKRARLELVNAEI